MNESKLDNKQIIEKLSNHIPFSLCDNGKKCCFHDGTTVPYISVWSALEEMHGDAAIRGKKLSEISPDLFEGSSACTFVKRKLR